MREMDELVAQLEAVHARLTPPRHHAAAPTTA
jgi:hypothetical protein